MRAVNRALHHFPAWTTPGSVLHCAPFGSAGVGGRSTWQSALGYLTRRSPPSSGAMSAPPAVAVTRLGGRTGSVLLGVWRARLDRRACTARTVADVAGCRGQDRARRRSRDARRARPEEAVGSGHRPRPRLGPPQHQSPPSQSVRASTSRGPSVGDSGDEQLAPQPGGIDRSADLPAGFRDQRNRPRVGRHSRGRNLAITGPRARG